VSDAGADAERTQGTVKFFRATKGYGFIVCDDKTEVFVHVSELANNLRELAENQRVSFILENHAKGKRALKVVPI
jgi:cold shock protein